MHRTSSRAWLGALSFVLLVATTTAAQAQQASVTGRVTEAGAGQPVSDVQVVVVGTTLGSVTNQDGRYTIRGVPAGAQQIRAIRIGYAESKKPVTVVAGQSVTVDFSLTKAVISLKEVVTTATGEQRRVEQGSAISNINAAEVTKTSPISSVSDVLN